LTQPRSKSDVFWFRSDEDRWCQVHVSEDSQQVLWATLNARRPQQPVLLILEERHENSPSCVLVDFDEETDGVSYVSIPLSANIARLRMDWENRPDRPKDRFGSFCKDRLCVFGSTMDFENPQSPPSFIATGTKIPNRAWCVR
jgi:hypothetical protein